MTGFTHDVLCMNEGCASVAQYKIAAAWSDGTTQELKTYALCCEQHLESAYRLSRVKRGQCRIAEGEQLSEPQIFRIQPGPHDRALVRLEELERKLATPDH